MSNNLLTNNIPERLWTPSFIYACVSNFLMGLSFYLLTPTLPLFIVEQFHTNKSIAGAILASYVIASLAIRPFAGYIVDTFPRKKIYIVSFVFFVALYIGYLFAFSIFILVMLRILHGFAFGVNTTSGNTLSIDIMPSSRRGEGVGYYGLTMNLSMAIGPLVGLLIYESYSFNPMFYSALIIGSIGLIFSFFIQSPAKEIKKKKLVLSLDRFILIKGIPIGINTIMIAIPYGMVVSFSAMYGIESGITNTGMFFTYMAMGLCLSRIFSGKLVDKGKIHFVAMLGIGILVVSFLMFSLGHTAFFYFLSAFCIGMGFGTVFPAFMTLFVDLAPHCKRGTATSTYMTSFDLGIGLGMILAGQIAEMYGLSVAFGLAVVCNFVSLMYYRFVSKGSYDKNRIENSNC